MKRPPRPGEKIFVVRSRPPGVLHEASVRSHSGLWIYYARRTELMRIIKPKYAAGPHDHRVHRNDEGKTWVRTEIDARAWRATYLLQNS